VANNFFLMQQNIHIDGPEGVALAIFIHFVGESDGDIIICDYRSHGWLLADGS
jgi:hypothetical protein